MVPARRDSLSIINFVSKTFNKQSCTEAVIFQVAIKRPSLLGGFNRGLGHE